MPVKKKSLRDDFSKKGPVLFNGFGFSVLAIGVLMIDPTGDNGAATAVFLFGFTMMTLGVLVIPMLLPVEPPPPPKESKKKRKKNKPPPPPPKPAVPVLSPREQMLTTGAKVVGMLFLLVGGLQLIAAYRPSDPKTVPLLLMVFGIACVLLGWRLPYILHASSAEEKLRMKELALARQRRGQATRTGNPKMVFGLANVAIFLALVFLFLSAGGEPLFFAMFMVALTIGLGTMVYACILFRNEQQVLADDELAAMEEANMATGDMESGYTSLDLLSGRRPGANKNSKNGGFDTRLTYVSAFELRREGPITQRWDDEGHRKKDKKKMTKEEKEAYDKEMAERRQERWDEALPEYDVFLFAEMV